MRSLAFIATGIALTVAIAPACGGSVASNCGSYFDALLSVQNQCGVPGVFFNAAERQDYVAECEAAAAAPGASNAAGQIGSCANDTKSRGCLGLFYSPPSCFLRGALADGSPCGTNEQCAGGVCIPSQPDPSSEIVCGTCASFLQAGAPCSSNSFPGCDPAVGDCDGTTCAVFIPRGGTCPQSNTYCAPGDECNDAGICDTVPTLGQSCNVDCNGPYTCTSGTCVSNGPSQPPPPVGAGSSCGLQGNGAACDTGLVCSLHTQTCVTPVPIGGACRVGAFECTPFAACIGGACAVPDYSVCK